MEATRLNGLDWVASRQGKVWFVFEKGGGLKVGVEVLNPHVRMEKTVSGSNKRINRLTASSIVDEIAGEMKRDIEEQ